VDYRHIDAARIPGLARDLGNDTSAARRFVDDFVDAWEPRLARVLRAVGSPVADDGLAALLTVATSSAMVGARSLGLVALDLHAETQRAGVMSSDGAQRLAVIGAESCVELRHAAFAWWSAQTDASGPVIR
jgi:hypothetical protein